MEIDAHLTCSDEYQLLETYCKKRKNQSLLRNAAHTDDKFGNVAEKLSKIVQPLNVVVQRTPVVEFFDDGVEADGEDDKVIYQLVELLKKTGDDLNEKIQNNRELLGYLQHNFNYSCFDKVTKIFISSVQLISGQKRIEEEIALTCEVTSRLSALDLQPMNRIMGYGAQYLQNEFTPLVKPHGGWEKVFDHDEEVH